MDENEAWSRKTLPDFLPVTYWNTAIMPERTLGKPQETLKKYWGISKWPSAESQEESYPKGNSCKTGKVDPKNTERSPGEISERILELSHKKYLLESQELLKVRKISMLRKYLYVRQK